MPVSLPPSPRTFVTDPLTDKVSVRANRRISSDPPPRARCHHPPRHRSAHHYGCDAREQESVTERSHAAPNAFTTMGSNTDLRIVNESEYRANNVNLNGIKRREDGVSVGYFGVINLLAPRVWYGTPLVEHGDLRAWTEREQRRARDCSHHRKHKVGAPSTWWCGYWQGQQGLPPGTLCGD